MPGAVSVSLQMMIEAGDQGRNRGGDGVLGLGLCCRGLAPGQAEGGASTPPEKGNRYAVPKPGDQQAAGLRARPCQVL